MKLLSKTLLILYLVLLLWLVLFKLSVDFSSVLQHGNRSLNLVPFAGYSPANRGEMLDNLLAFIPLGLLLNLNLKGGSFGRKLGYIFLLSLTVEAAQFVLSIGVSDITDLIMNTLGGCLGLAAYDVSRRYVHKERLDQSIIIVGTAILIVCVLLRVLVFQVHYRSAPPEGLRTRTLQEAAPANVPGSNR